MRNLAKKPIKLELGERDILALSFAGLTLFSLIIGVSSYISARSCSRLAQGAKATLVQQPDGTAFIANPKPANYRDPLMVRKYVYNWVTYTFTLPGELNISGHPFPGLKSQGLRVTAFRGQKIADEGIIINGRRIPTNVISGAYGWAANKRKEFIEAYLNEGIVPEDYFSSGSSSTQEAEIDFLGQAELIDEKQQIFSVNVVATISKHQGGKPTGEVEFYRRKIIVSSIPIPQKKPDANDSIYQQLSYQWRKEGLQIREINPL